MPLSKDPKQRKKQLDNLKKGMAKKGQVLNPKGRPRTTVRSMIEEFERQGMIVPTAQEISKIYIFIASQTEEELKQTMLNKELPMMTRIIARGVLNKKGLDVVERIMDRAYGKQQRIDLTSGGEKIKSEPLTLRFIASKEELEKIQNEVPDIPANGSKEG